MIVLSEKEIMIGDCLEDNGLVELVRVVKLRAVVKDLLDELKSSENEAYDAYMKEEYERVACVEYAAFVAFYKAQQHVHTAFAPLLNATKPAGFVRTEPQFRCDSSPASSIGEDAVAGGVTTKREVVEGCDGKAFPSIRSAESSPLPASSPCKDGAMMVAQSDESGSPKAKATVSVSSPSPSHSLEHIPDGRLGSEGDSNSFPPQRGRAERTSGISLCLFCGVRHEGTCKPEVQR